MAGVFVKLVTGWIPADVAGGANTTGSAVWVKSSEGEWLLPDVTVAQPTVYVRGSGPWLPEA